MDKIPEGSPPQAVPELSARPRRRRRDSSAVPEIVRCVGCGRKIAGVPGALCGPCFASDGAGHGSDRRDGWPS